MKRSLGKKFVLGAAAGLFMFSQTISAQEIAESNGFVMPVGDMALRAPAKPMELLSSADAEYLNEQMSEYVPKYDDLLINNATEFYYYNNLDPMAKQIYDVMYGVAKDPVSIGNIGLLMTDMDPQSEEFYYEFNIAGRALCFDHPELFWLYSGENANMGFFSEAVSQRGLYFVYIMMFEPFEEFEDQMTAFNQATQQFLADIDTGISEYETIRQIHDKLIGLVEYNYPVAEDPWQGINGLDLAHTAFGALVSDSSGNVNYAVCDGYALAFEYLLQQCGIESVFIGGMAGPTEELSGGHAWNMVKLDGTWYETDCTWNDSENLLSGLSPDTMEYKDLTEALNDVQYKEKIDHSMFLISTEQITHFMPGNAFDYVTKDQKRVLQPIQESVHIRFELNDPLKDYDPAVISLAPIATQNYK